MSRDRAEVAGLLRLEAAGWGEVGSPFYASLGRFMADDVEAGGVVWDVLGPSTSGARFGEAHALRLLGGVHRMVLAGNAPALARHYASTGGDGDATAAWPAFAALLGRWRDDGVREVRFELGAADGFADADRAGADLLLSFGRATWPHLLARAMLAEQLFRATSIIAGHPYHREG